MSIRGVKGSSEERLLESSRLVPFLRGQEDVFMLRSFHLGELQAVFFAVFFELILRPIRILR